MLIKINILAQHWYLYMKIEHEARGKKTNIDN